MKELLFLIIYTITAYGLSSYVIYFNGPFHIFEKFRETVGGMHPQLAELLSCEACTSSWIGLMLSGFGLLFMGDCHITPWSMILEGCDMWWLILLLDTAYTCGSVWMTFRIEDYLTIMASKKQEEDGR